MTRLFPVFFLGGFVFGAAASAVFLLSIAALAIRRRRRSLMASVIVLSKVIIASGAIIGAVCLWENFLAWYGANKFERYTFFHQRFFPMYAYWYWLEFFGNVIAPQLFWFRRVRTNAWLSLAVSAIIVLPSSIDRLITLPAELSKILPGVRWP